ncbi:hypothetical protein HMPREF1544_11739 [Mucor circinelloides 1006PhL]|uniref:Uncharacterized protein n=1 Tax=Mucor circinelloides f. circinelloides (strain 1006PhL) TaxID=1220926 RepID=S2IW53_MUCC1|nr:hypothetical protein HMPREF1544_11739 [Mucor circinelloides 1006PhL]
MQLPTTASKLERRTQQQLVNTALTYGIATTTASLKYYQLPFLNNTEIVVYILNSSKTSGAISRCFDTPLCSISFAMLFLPGGLVLSATSHYTVSVWFSAVCKSSQVALLSGLVLSLQVICIATLFLEFRGSEYRHQAQGGAPEY